MFGVSVGYSIVGAAVWDSVSKKWTLPPGTARKGRGTARAENGRIKTNEGSIITILMTSSTLIQMFRPPALTI